MGTYATEERYDNRRAAVGDRILVSYGPTTEDGVLYAGTIAKIHNNDTLLFNVPGLTPPLVLDTEYQFVVTRTEGDVSSLRGGKWTWADNILVGIWTRTPPLCPECAGDLGGNFIGRLEDHKGDCSRFPL